MIVSGSCIADASGVLMEHLTSQGTAKPSDEEEPKFLDAVLSSVELDDSDSETPSSDNVTSELERQYRYSLPSYCMVHVHGTQRCSFGSKAEA